jgi:hypothetical protein
MWFKKKVEIQKQYPLFDNADRLACPHLRTIEDWVDNDWLKNWIAKEKDPCPTCENSACHNYKKRFDLPNRLTIEKGIVINPVITSNSVS